MIYASDLNRYIYCPRSLYLTSVLGIEPEPTLEQRRGILGHEIRRELSIRQSKILSKVSSAKQLKPLIHEELEAVLADIPYIHKGGDLEYCIDYLPKIKSQVIRELDLIENEMSAMVEEFGLEKALEYVTPWKVEYTVSSRLLGLSGRVDKVMLRRYIEPHDIKTGRISDNYHLGDSIQLAAYGLLLEEKFGQKVPHGYLEYVRAFESRPIEFTKNLRRQVLKVRDEINKLFSAEIPEICPHGQPRKCEACNLRDECYMI